MMYPYVLCIAMILLFIIQNTCIQENNEYMNNLNSKKDIDLLNDNLFANVIMYNNDEDVNQKLGINKCIDDPKCETCVEFGVSGIAFCFPKKQ